MTIDGILVTDLWQSVDNSLAPLSAKQLLFLDKLENQCKHFQSDDTTAHEEADPQSSDKSMAISVPVDNLFDFEKWFETIENNFKANSDSRHKKLLNNYSQIKQLLSEVNTSLTNLNQLKDQYISVSNKTKALHSSCEQLLQQQHGLIVAIEMIGQKLTYFNELDPISKKLSSPTMLVLNESLMPMLSRLDECIAYLESKPNYRESESYLKQFKHLQSQALSTIRNHVIKTLQQTGQQVMPESKDALTPNDSVFTLFYGKFQNNAHRIKTLMSQIEDRTQLSDLYQGYLNECHQCYFNIRESLIGPVLSLAIEEMVTSYKRNYCALIRSSTNMIIHICQDEYQLFFQFFTQQSITLTDFLDKICQKLYDTLRPVVIHLEHLESLSEICYILKNELIEENILNQSLELESFIKSMERLLQDTQERLVYRSNIYIQTNIIEYSPSSGDLAYPEKLEMMKNIAESLNDGKSEDSNDGRVRGRSDSVSSSLSDISFATNDRTYERAKSHLSRSPADLHGMWYPTVRRTLLCLNKLYRSLDKSTFQGLSQEVLAACIDSLDLAHIHITKRKTLLDGQLFFIKHLLIIREQIAPFHIEITLKEVSLDFSRTKNAAFDLIQKRENLFSLTTNNALLKFIFEGAPQVTEKIVDSQKAVDNKIKTKCEEFITHSTEMLIRPLITLNELAKVLQKDKQLKSHQIFSSADNLKSSVNEAMTHLKTNLVLVKSKMSLYLANKDTEAILFKQIRAKIEENYNYLKILIENNYTEVERETICLCHWSDIDTN